MLNGQAIAISTLLLLLGRTSPVPSLAQPEAGYLTPCDLAQNPAQYDGAIVTVRGTIDIMFEISRISDATCPSANIWLDAAGLEGPSASLTFGQDEYAQDHEWTEYAPLESDMDGRRYLAGEELSAQWRAFPPRAAISPRLDKNLKKLNRMLRIKCPCPPATYCMSLPSPWSHEVVMTGRFEHVSGPIILRDSQGHRGMLTGFGHMSRYKSRFVLQSVEAIKSTRVGCQGEASSE